MKILIKGGRVIDPANNIEETLDILVENSRISQVAKGIKIDADHIIEAADKIVMPGIIDLHVHLREPGREDKETIATATLAGLSGGVTSLLAMPNTQPAIDSVENAKLLKGLIKNSARANVFIAGTITKARQGKDISDIAGLRKQGVLAISDDGSSVDSDEVMLKALKLAKQQGLLTICHCEDKALSGNGVVNLGVVSTRMGLRGISPESEYKRVARDIGLAEKACACVHIAHISCSESVEIVARAKKKGIKVTCETAPHYFSLTEEATLGFDTNMKVNPPLRSRDDMLSIRQGLADGTIDAIASDHAPHTESEKEIEFEAAGFGTIGLETELAVTVTELVHSGVLDWSGLVKKFAVNPAKILGIDKAGLGPGSYADIIVVSPDREWIVQKSDLLSKSKNCAFLGKKLKGMVEYTICGGKISYKL